jgi:hypothetical protein
MKVDALESAAKVWDQDYSDVPWIRDALRIDPPRIESGGTFQFLIDGGCGSYAFTPMKATSGESAPQPIPPSGYSLTMAADGSGIVLRVDPEWLVDHVLVEQVADAPSIARVACLWLDTTAGQWEVVYNALDRQAALIESIRTVLGPRKLPFSDALLKFIRHLLDAEAGKAVAVYESTARLRDQQNAMQRFCERFELQLNAHGLKRTFRFWTDSEKKAYLEGANVLMTSLEGLSAHVCLGFGAVLGWVRDQDLIAHDDDLDILIAFDRHRVADLGAALEVTRRALQARGHQVLGTFFSHLWVATPGGTGQTFLSA